MNKTIFKAIHGSKLFGLDNSNSDTDHKGIFQVPIEDIILGTAKKTITESTSTSNSKNSSLDQDIELKELRTFISDCLQGQPYAVEMLFTPENMIIETSKIWEFVQYNRSKLIPNNMQGFSSYAYSQSQKYSLIGERLLELKRVISWFKSQNPNFKLIQIVDSLPQSKFTFVSSFKHSSKLQYHPDEMRLCCLGMIFQLQKPIKECTPTLLKRLNQYSQRSSDAAQNDGIDWKSYSHALRLLYEWEELITSSKLTFPSPNQKYLLDVKLGKIPIVTIQNKIFDEFERINSLPNNLPPSETKFWDKWLVELYLEENWSLTLQSSNIKQN